MLRSLSVLALTAASLPAADLTFEKDVRPVLKEHCFHCHGEDGETKGGLDVRLTRFLLKGGKNGPVIVPGRAEASHLIELVKSGEMPKGKSKLKDTQIAVLEAWIAQGAKTARPEPETLGPEYTFTDEERAWWSLQPIQRPKVPQNAEPHPIDAFISAKHAEKGLSFSREADPLTLIRRASFDLCGLPPELGDASADLTLYVDKLLSSPHYGERWGRHWLDAAGYSDSEGYGEKDLERKWAWKYRDYVIRSLNADKPFDQFVREQLAGDEMVPQPYKNLSPDAIDKLTATGFLRMAPNGTGEKNDAETQNANIADTIKMVGSSLYGMTIGCAQCHDHPYDPLSQADFYRLRAYFDDTVLTQRDKQLGPSVRPFAKGVPASVVFVRGDHTRPGPRIQPGLPRLMNGAAQDRAALAQALTSSENALFLRTMANRLWQQHFGTPLSANPGDLGHQGTAPENPALFDWLAAEIPRQNWSLKKLHTLILLSRTYQQASLPPRRLTGEMLRDTLLSISGDLNLQTGGESVHLPLPAEISSTLLKKHAEKPSEPAQLNRRSIYTFARRNARHPVLDLFDRPDALAPCSRRNESTTAPQALLMLNSDLSVQTAQKLAAGLKADFGSETPQIIRAAILRCFGREPRKADFDAATGFFAKQADFSLALEDYCLALLNANEFIFVD